jgi:hypothetical protein
MISLHSVVSRGPLGQSWGRQALQCLGEFHGEWEEKQVETSRALFR